ncbi:MAG: AMP-binding protein [Chlamydiales bacterium]|nr:AMP-binding protein [Chlamydiales bacterium]
MGKIRAEFWRIFTKIALLLRYKVEVRGMEALRGMSCQERKSIIFLPNHTSELDPAILLTLLNKDFLLTPLVANNMFQVPIIGPILRQIGCLEIPNSDFGGNEYTSLLAKRAIKEITHRLNEGSNLLIYPSGKLKNSGLEDIGGASGVHQILAEALGVKVFLIRTSGLWGSSFSKALTGSSPDLGKTLLSSLKKILKNGIFFLPKRKVLVEIVPAPIDFPRRGSKMELNAYLERWYNAPFDEKGEPLYLVQDYFWSQKAPKIEIKKDKNERTLKDISKSIQEGIINEISRICKRPASGITAGLDLSKDLGMDSLDVIELITFLDDVYSVKNVHPADLVCVLDAMWMASSIDTQEPMDNDLQGVVWPDEKKRVLPEFAIGNTLQEVFLRSIEGREKDYAVADDVSGPLTYFQVKVAAILLALEIKKLPGEEVGILMPATTAGILLVFATLLAKKTPVMLNWTIGAKNLKEIVNASKIEVILTSHKFLTQAKMMDVEGIDHLFISLEHMRKRFTFTKKIMAWLLAKKKTQSLLREFSIDSSIENKPAVLLFTSGTESTPKGVPLTHQNILSNQRSAFSCIASMMSTQDVFYSFLPPFHSFGFVVTGILPFFVGLRVAFMPDPTDSLRLAKGMYRYLASVVCSAPTFLNALLKKATKKELATLKLMVTGAEKAPQSLFDAVKKMDHCVLLLEGYGITECSPILTLTRPDKQDLGVGTPLLGTELLIVDLNTHAPLSVQKEGLILARGPGIFNGYWQKSLPSPFVEVDGKKWYVTGDLGYLTENGSLILSGRLKRFVKMGGEMVNLLSIEETLLHALQDKFVSSSEESVPLALCAKEQEDLRAELVLFVTFPILVNEVNEILRKAQFSSLIKISQIKQIGTMPLLGTGKVNYRELQKGLA